MPLDPQQLIAFPFKDRQHRYDSQHTILYALAVGMGTDPVDSDQLRFVYERSLTALPTMATTLAPPIPWLHLPETSLSWRHVMNGGQTVVLHRPIPPAAKVHARTFIEEIVDQGRERGAIIYLSRTICEIGSEKPIATIEQTLICRADGGFAPMPGKARPVHALPNRDPDVSVRHTTLPQQALLYRLCGDLNPLHAIPKVAISAGFERPVLHGMCTFGIAGHALLKSVANYCVEDVRSIRARFSAPVFPGDTITTSVWDEGNGRFSFACHVDARKAKVLDNGVFEVG
jgi:acyl dehydratase